MSPYFYVCIINFSTTVNILKYFYQGNLILLKPYNLFQNNVLFSKSVKNLKKKNCFLICIKYAIELLFDL